MSRFGETLAAAGYVVLPGLVRGAVMDRLAGGLDALVERRFAEHAAAGFEPAWADPGVLSEELRPSDFPDLLVLRDHAMPRTLAEEVLGGRVQVTGLTLRAPLPGAGHQGLHPDSQAVADGTARFAGADLGEPWPWLTVMWAIRALDRANGTLRVLPGSHRRSDVMEELIGMGPRAMGPHPGEVRVVCDAGSAIVFNSAGLWHSGTFNDSSRPRLVVNVGFRLAEEE
jgi:hypothetical protein